MKSRTIHIVGGGFSGLTMAYFLVLRGYRIEIFEKESRLGGLIDTVSGSEGLVETAANGLLNSRTVETLFRDLGLKFAVRKSTASHRYIFRQRPRRWPLSIRETLAFLGRLCWHWLKRDLRPKANESVAVWGHRIGGGAFVRFLLAPALQGVYAGDVEKLSAELLVGRFFQPKERAEKPSSRGTIAPEKGMAELTERLKKWLVERGVQIHSGTPAPAKFTAPTVIATSAWTAGDLLRDSSPELAEHLHNVEALPLISATLFFAEPPDQYRGFGCLFPKEEKFHALGVLFNSDIFEGRASGRSETWILGGALDRGLLSLSDDELLARIQEDRRRLFPDAGITGFRIQRWPKALPHYTLEWRNRLSQLVGQLNPPRGIFLTGNYLGQIGLSRILEYNRKLANEIEA